MARTWVINSSATPTFDVAFEQGFADFGESGVQVLFGELALAAEIFEGALKLLCERFKHERELRL